MSSSYADLVEQFDRADALKEIDAPGALSAFEALLSVDPGTHKPSFPQVPQVPVRHFQTAFQTHSNTPSTLKPSTPPPPTPPHPNPSSPPSALHVDTKWWRWGWWKKEVWRGWRRWRKRRIFFSKFWRVAFLSPPTPPTHTTHTPTHTPTHTLSLTLPHTLPHSLPLHPHDSLVSLSLLLAFATFCRSLTLAR